MSQVETLEITVQAVIRQANGPVRTVMHHYLIDVPTEYNATDTEITVIQKANAFIGNITRELGAQISGKGPHTPLEPGSLPG